MRTDSSANMPAPPRKIGSHADVVELHVVAEKIGRRKKGPIKPFTHADGCKI